MARPLAGVRILESTTMITGPLAGMMLADLGADVIKVENPDGGDPFRSFRGGKYSPYFFAYNRNKRSIALDIRSEEGKKLFKGLVAQSDVLIENSRPGVFARLGLGADELRRINPKIIVCSISGFGPSGPYKDRPAYDAVAQALAGVSSLCFYGEPQITGPTIADSVTGIFAAYGILGALYERAMTGVARTLDVNMLDSTVAFLPDPFLTTTMLNIEPGPLMRVQASQSYAVTCSDGKMIAVHMSSQDKFWKGCTESFNCAHLTTDPRFDTRAKRVDNYIDLAAEFRKAALSQPREFWMARLAARDVPHAPVNNLLEVIQDPQVRHLGTFADMQHPVCGSYKTVRRPVRYDGARDDQPLNLPPEFNADGAAILRELGASQAEIAAWESHNQTLAKHAP